jgi:hypothetical protein
MGEYGRIVLETTSYYLKGKKNLLNEIKAYFLTPNLPSKIEGHNFI